MQKTSKKDALIPLLYEGDFESAFPEGVTKSLAQDFRKPEKYYTNLTSLAPLGILPTLYGFRKVNGTTFYETALALFESAVREIKRDLADDTFNW